MNAIERKIKGLEGYLPDLTARDDLDRFWSRSLERFRPLPPPGAREKAVTPLRSVDAYEVAFSGFDDTPIYGWYLVPERKGGAKLPCVVIFHGYRGDRGYPEDYAQWLLLGTAVFAVDTRGQGGKTGDRLPNTFGRSAGWVTQGLLDKDGCYYKAAFIDALRALDWIWEQPEIDRERICVTGASQGGGLTLAAACLSDKPSFAVADIPNMCHLDYGILNSRGSLAEIADFLNRHPEDTARVLETMSYFDIMNLASRIKIAVVLSVCLQDPICPPETVYAAYNRIESEKKLHVYPFEAHNVNARQNRLKLLAVKERFAL